MNTQRATHLFQSDAALAIGQERAAKAARTAQGEEYGHPIWLGVGPSPLPSEDRDASDAPSSAPRDFASLAERAAGADGGLTKVIAATMPRPDQPQVWTAESGRMARHTHLESGDAMHQLKGHGGPVSGVASLVVSRSRTLLFTASWDKHIRIWAIGQHAKPSPLATIEHAGTDLLKSLHVDPMHRILLSGGSDKMVRVWDLGPLMTWAQSLSDADWPYSVTTPAPLPSLRATLRAHTRPVVVLTSLPPAPSDAILPDVPTSCTFFSADSMGRILQVSVEENRCEVLRELNGHETNIHAMCPVWRETEDGRYTADIWTVSSDKTVRRFPLSAWARGPVLPGRVSQAGGVLGTQPAVYADVQLILPSGARSVLPLEPLHASLRDQVLIGAADGSLQVWHLSAPSHALHALDGHWHEVTFLGVWYRHQAPWIVSCSLDGTIRRWPLTRVLEPASTPSAPPATTSTSMLTAEEEAELADLLSSDDDDITV